MNESTKRHLPIIALVTLVGCASAYFIMSRIAASAESMTIDSFNGFMFLVPCIVMLVGTAVIAMTAEEINRQLYLINVAICLVTGLISVVGASFWLADPTISAQLIANSGEGAVIVPVYNAPIIMIRDVAAFFVIPTVGSIIGAWLGSRLHPMKASRGNRPKRKRK